MTVKAKIYQPTKTSMQSGRAKTRQWVYEYLPATPQTPEPLMGWASGDTLAQVQLQFDSKEGAVAYARKKGVPFEVIEPKVRAPKASAYQDNFANDRKMPF